MEADLVLQMPILIVKFAEQSSYLMWIFVSLLILPKLYIYKYKKCEQQRNLLFNSNREKGDA